MEFVGDSYGSNFTISAVLHVSFHTVLSPSEVSSVLDSISGNALSQEIFHSESVL